MNFEDYGDELDTETWKRVMREGRAMGALQIGFSGGEPMQRSDVEELVAEADELGYYTNLITSGVGLTTRRLKALKKAGLKQIQLSIQSSDREITNRLIGTKAYDIKLAIAHAIKAEGFPMVLNVPVCRHNIEDTGDILSMAENLRVDYLEFANIQYYNWALLNRSELLPTRDQLQRAEAQVMAARTRLGGRMTIYFVVPDYYDSRPKACMNGWGAIHLTIAPDGAALPCQEARVIKGLKFPNVRDVRLEWIWRESPTFRKFRGEEWMNEPCRSCDERTKDFGGCRCQAFLLTGDAAATDPVCAHSPNRHLIDAAVVAAVSEDWPRRPLILRKKGAAAAASADQ